MIYVMSDLHGHYKEFMRMLSLIKFDEKNDKLYILGDVIDKGPAPVPLLLYIASKQNIILLRGNHEDMMLKSFKEMNTPGAKRYMALWMQNGGSITLSQFVELTEIEQSLLIDYIEDLPIIQRIECDNRKYYLTHSTYIKELCNKDKDCEYANDLSDKQIYEALWSREYPYNDVKTYTEVYNIYKDYTLIGGHTPAYKLSKDYYYSRENNILYKTHILRKKHYINVDGGLAGASNEKCIRRLGCLRLDDMTEYYIEQAPI